MVNRFLIPLLTFFALVALVGFAGFTAADIGVFAASINVNITSPTEGIWHTSPVNSFSWTASSRPKELDSCWYSLNGGASVNIPSCVGLKDASGTEVFLSPLTNGIYNITFNAHSPSGYQFDTVFLSVDTTAPTVTAPSDIIGFEANGTLTDVSIGTATATDLVDPAPVITNDAPAQFPVGTTVVTWTATDAAGNSATATQTINVVDTTPPAIDSVSDITAEATGPSGADVTFTAPMSHDIVDGDVVSVCDASSGTFPLGTTTVTCSKTDNAGNTAVPSVFTITVVDTTAPTVTAPSDVVAEATSSSGAEVSYSGESATDVVDGSVAVNCAPASGSTFALGDTTVTCTATDAAGNVGTDTFNVEVVDTTAPLLNLPADITAEATGPDGAIVTFDVNATDTADDSVDVVCTPASGSTFALDPLEPNMVTKDVMCTATDNSGNSVTGGFNINVVDTTAPVITLIGESAVSLTVGDVYTDAGATAEDIVDGNLTDAIAVNSNVNTSAAGSYNVSYDVTDKHGNSAVQVVRIVNVAEAQTPPVTSVNEESGGGGGGDGSACYSNWTCSAWGACVDGLQTRTCKLTKTNCFHSAKPAESQSCTIGAPEAPTAPTEVTTQGEAGAGGLGGITGAVIGALGGGWTVAAIFIAGVFGVAVFLRLRK